MVVVVVVEATVDEGGRNASAKGFKTTSETKMQTQKRATAAANPWARERERGMRRAMPSFLVPTAAFRQRQLRHWAGRGCGVQKHARVARVLLEKYITETR